MPKFSSVGRTKLVVVVAIGWLLELTTPCTAIPAFARQYGLMCSSCHTVPARLNLRGYKFLRNGYRFNEGDTEKMFLADVRLGARYVNQPSANIDTGYLQKAELVSAGRLAADTRYYLAWEAHNRTLQGPRQYSRRDFRFEDAYIVKELNRTTQLTVGKFRVANQIPGSLRSSISEPLALSASLDDFAPSAREIGVRLEWMQTGAPSGINGNYYSITVPPHENGAFLQAYHRRGLNTLGAFTFLGNDKRLYGAASTYQKGRWFSSLVAVIADGRTQDDTRLSWENEVQVSRYATLGVRWDRQSNTADPNRLVPYINLAFPATNWTVRAQYDRLPSGGTGRHTFDLGVFFNAAQW